MTDIELDHRIAALVTAVGEAAPPAPAWEQILQRADIALEKPGRRRPVTSAVAGLAVAAILFAALAIGLSNRDNVTVSAGGGGARLIPSYVPAGLAMRQAQDLQPKRSPLDAPALLYGQTITSPDVAVIAVDYAARGAFHIFTGPKEGTPVQSGGRAFRYNPGIPPAKLATLAWSESPVQEAVVAATGLSETQMVDIALGVAVRNGQPVLADTTVLPAGQHLIAQGDMASALAGIAPRGGARVTYGGQPSNLHQQSLEIVTFRAQPGDYPLLSFGPCR